MTLLKILFMGFAVFSMWHFGYTGVAVGLSLVFILLEINIVGYETRGKIK